MSVRRYVSRWLLTTLGAVSLVAVACSSSTPDDAERDALATDIVPTATGSSGVVTTDVSSDAVGEGGAWLGAATVPIPELLAGILGLSAGERVAWVTDDGPADGVLIIGDTITAVGGNPVDSEHGLAEALGSLNARDVVSLTVHRGDETLELQIELGVGPEHPKEGGLAEVEDLFDRAVSGEFTFLDGTGGEHTVAFATGTLSGVNDGSVSMTRTGSGPTTMGMSPNVFVWIDGAPETAADLSSHSGKPARLISLDESVLAVFVGGIIPPALEALEGLIGTGGEGLIGALGALEDLQGLFAQPDSSD